MLHLAVLLLPLGYAFAAVASPTASHRNVFLAAEQAVQGGDRSRYHALAATLRDYPLYPYLQRYDLMVRLDQAPDSEVEAFLAEHSGQPVAAKLRGAWLRQLAGRKRWQAFLRAYRDGYGISQQCRQLLALYRTGNRQKALTGVPALWLHGSSRPDACDPIFDIWQSEGGISTHLAWQRIELAMVANELGLAKYLRKFVPANQRRYVDQWLKVRRNPALLLDEQALSADNPQRIRIVMQVLDSWANHDSPAAAAALDRLAPRYQLPAQQRLLLERKLALYLASRGDASAQRRLEEIPQRLQTDSVREWMVRTSMRDGDWPAVIDRIDAMPAEQRDNPRWRYWRARALELTGHGDSARTLYAGLATQRSYYGFLAADRIGEPYTLRHQPMQFDSALVETELKAEGIERARELFLLGRLQEARREWWHHFKGADAATMKAAATIAAGWGWDSEAIASVARARDWNDLDLRFPLPYRDRIIAAAKREDIEPEWVYAILRQESIFRSDARSSAGALGLMQLLPATAKRVARELKLHYTGSKQLLDADTNIRLGSSYLKTSRNDLQGRALLATAAYNAGPRRVNAWLPESAPLPADVWVETVPYHETRNYLRKVMEYSVIYQHRLKSEPGFLRRQMQPVPVREDTKTS